MKLLDKIIDNKFLNDLFDNDKNMKFLFMEIQWYMMMVPLKLLY